MFFGIDSLSNLSCVYIFVYIDHAGVSDLPWWSGSWFVLGSIFTTSSGCLELVMGPSWDHTGPSWVSFEASLERQEYPGAAWSVQPEIISS